MGEQSPKTTLDVLLSNDFAERLNQCRRLIVDRLAAWDPADASSYGTMEYDGDLSQEADDLLQWLNSRVSTPLCGDDELYPLLHQALGYPCLRDDYRHWWLMDSLRTFVQEPRTHIIDWRNHLPATCEIYSAQIGRHVRLQVDVIKETKVDSNPWSSKFCFGPEPRSLRIAARGYSKQFFEKRATDVERLVSCLATQLQEKVWSCWGTAVRIDNLPGGSSEADVDDANRRLCEIDSIVFKRCLTLVLDPLRNKKDRMRHRLRTSLQLMTEAKFAAHPSVAVALWCAAIEALVSRKGDSTISSTFRQNIATLLQPNPELRMAAEDSIKKLYDARSECVHGNAVTASKPVAEASRVLSAGVLRAVIEWMGLHEDKPKAPTEDEFVTEMRRAYTSGKAMEGISHHLCKFLPTQID